MPGRLFEEDPPEKLEDWPDGQAKYETFGGAEGDHSYDEGGAAELATTRPSVLLFGLRSWPQAQAFAAGSASASASAALSASPPRGISGAAFCAAAPPTPTGEDAACMPRSSTSFMKRASASAAVS